MPVRRTVSCSESARPGPLGPTLSDRFPPSECNGCGCDMGFRSDDFVPPLTCRRSGDSSSDQCSVGEARQMCTEHLSSHVAHRGFGGASWMMDVSLVRLPRFFAHLRSPVCCPGSDPEQRCHRAGASDCFLFRIGASWALGSDSV